MDPRAYFYKGVRAAIAWLHAEARTMNDPHAQSVLNNAGFHLGLSKPAFSRIADGPSGVTVVFLSERADGGLRVWSDDEPGLILSGANADAVSGDIWRAIKVLREHRTSKVRGADDGAARVHSPETRADLNTGPREAK
jgi:hypothetical protein